MHTTIAKSAAQQVEYRYEPARRQHGADFSRPPGARPVRLTGLRNYSGVSSAPHPVHGAEHEISARGIVAAGLLSATVVAGLCGIAHWRADTPSQTTVPTSVVAPHGVSAPDGDAQ